MVVIRFSRSGSKKRPYYRAVVADRRMPRDGRYIEQVGVYDPKIKNSVRFLMNRVNYWIKVGAKPSKTVTSLIKRFKNQ